MDVYTPPGLGPGERRPAILFVHGGPVGAGMKPKGMGVFKSYGALAAASGYSTVDAFLREGLQGGASLELLNHPKGRHGFDILDDDARSREIIARTFDFLKTHLR